MTLLRFDPFRSFEQTTRKMNQLLNDLEKGVNFEYGTYKPIVDISEDSKAVYVYAELPGIDKNDIKVSVNEENILSIKGEKKLNRAENVTVHKNEIIKGKFERKFILPDNLNTEDISAKFENGLLELKINKIEPPKPKEIEIQI